MRNEISTIDFYGDKITAVLDRQTNDIYTPVRPICEIFGIASNKQIRKIQNHPVLSDGVTIMVSPTRGAVKKQNMFCIRHDLVPLWLTTININKVKPELRDRLYLYQKEAAKVLAEYFLGRAKDNTIEAFIRLANSNANDKDIETVLSNMSRATQNAIRLAIGMYLSNKNFEHGEKLEFYKKLGIGQRTAQIWQQHARKTLCKS